MLPVARRLTAEVSTGSESLLAYSKRGCFSPVTLVRPESRPEGKPLADWAVGYSVDFLPRSYDRNRVELTVRGGPQMSASGGGFVTLFSVRFGPTRCASDRLR